MATERNSLLAWKLTEPHRRTVVTVTVSIDLDERRSLRTGRALLPRFPGVGSAQPLTTMHATATTQGSTHVPPNKG